MQKSGKSIIRQNESKTIYRMNGKASKSKRHYMFM